MIKVQDPKLDDYIKLKVLGNDNNEIHFRVKTTTSIQKLKKAYCDRLDIDVNSLRFLYDGKRLNDSKTPKSYNMINDDIIEVYKNQTGG